MDKEELEKRIINYLEKLEKNHLSQPVSEKKKNLLLASQKKYKEIEQAKKEYQELSKLVSKEEQTLTLEEIKKLSEQKEKIIAKIKEQIVEEENISQNIVMEIRPGPGGDEAGLFVNDLYCMYANFAKKKD